MALIADIESDFGPIDDRAKVTLVVEVMLLSHELALAPGPRRGNGFPHELFRHAERTRDHVLAGLGREYLESVFRDLWHGDSERRDPNEVFAEALERSGYSRRRLRLGSPRTT